MNKFKWITIPPLHEEAIGEYTVKVIQNSRGFYAYVDDAEYASGRRWLVKHEPSLERALIKAGKQLGYVVAAEEGVFP